MEHNNIVNEVVKLKTELKNALVENGELKKRHHEDTEKMNLVSLKNASLLSEIADEKKMLQLEFDNYKEESLKDIKRLQEELDKNVIMLNCLKDEILFKEEELKKAEIIEKLYKEESQMNQEKDRKIKDLENMLTRREEEEKDARSKEEQNNDGHVEIEQKNEELKILNKKYEQVKKTNNEIEKKIYFLKEEVDYYKNNENSFIMQNIFNAENNLDDSTCKKYLLKISVLYNALYKIVVYDQRSLYEKDKLIYSLEKENTHFLKKFIADEMYCLYLKDCISKINLTYQIDLHKQEKKYMLLNSEYDELYNKFLQEKNENLLLNERYDKIIFNQKKEINNLKSHISIQNKDKEILTKYIDNYITYIENSYEKYCLLNTEYKNLEELVKDLEEKNKNLMILVNGINADMDGDPSKGSELNNENKVKNKRNTITMNIDHMKLIKNDIKDKDIKIIELESKNMELEKTIHKLNEELVKNRKAEYEESESSKIKDLCFDLKDICSKLELELKEKNYIIEELTERITQADKKSKDNQVILELSEFRIQNFNDNMKYYQQKVAELGDKLQKKEAEVTVFHEYNERLKEEKEKMTYEQMKLIERVNELQDENDHLRNEVMFLRKEASLSKNHPDGKDKANPNDNRLISAALVVDDSSYVNEKSTTHNDERSYQHSENEQKEESNGTMYKGIFKFIQPKKNCCDDKDQLGLRVNKLTDENLLLIKENEEIFDKLQTVSSENVKLKNDCMYFKADAEKSLFYLEYEKKEKLKYKLLLRQNKRKGKELKRTFNKMMGTMKDLVISVKKIDKENKKNDINNSFFISSSSENNSNEELLSDNDNTNTQLMVSSVGKSKKSLNNTSVDGKHSFYSLSTKVPRASENEHADREREFEGRSTHRTHKHERKHAKRYMKIRMHRFSICSNFKINVDKYKKACKEAEEGSMFYLKDTGSGDLHSLAIQPKDAKGIDTFYSIPNSTDSKVINVSEEMKKKKKRKGNNFSIFQTSKMINDLNYIRRKYDSKVKETLTMQRKLMENEKELNGTNIKYENLLNEHDSLISQIKERTEKLVSIEKNYNLLFEKYSETQDEMKMHEKKTQEIFNECNELVEYMKKKENKIKEFDEHLKKMEIKYKEEKEKNDILTKDNVSLDNLNAKYKEDIELYRKKLESMQTELKLRLSKIDELELIQKNSENEMFYLKSATYKYEINLKEAHDELNRINEATVKLRKEVSEKEVNLNMLKEQILNRDYFLYSINESLKRKEYFYKSVKQRVQGFNKTFIELCESFEMSEVKKFNELYEGFEYNDASYKKHMLNFQLHLRDKFVDTVDDIVKTVDALSEFNLKYEEEKNEMANRIKDLENKLKMKMNENNELYEQYDRNMKNVLLERDERIEDCLILSEDVKKKNQEIHTLVKELEEKNLEFNEVHMKCTFLSNEVKNLEGAKIHLKEKLREIESEQEKQIDFLKKENDYLKEDIVSINKVINNLDEEIEKLKGTVDNLKQEKYAYEKEVEKLREIIDEEKRFNDILKENEQNFIQEIKEAHKYAINKEEEVNMLKLNHELEKKKYVDEIDHLKIKNKEIQDSVKNQLKMVSDLEVQMLEYKVLLDKNTSMKMLVQDLENKVDELIKDNEKLCIDLKKEKLISEEKEKNIVALNEDVKLCETKIHENETLLLKLKDEKDQLNEEIFILNDIKKSKDSIIEELENNLRKAVFGDVKLNEMERSQLQHKVFTEEDLGIAKEKEEEELDFNDIVNSTMCIFNNNGNLGPNLGSSNRNNTAKMVELKKYSLFLKEENDAMKQELRKLKDRSSIDERKNVEMQRIIERRDDIIRKMNNEIVTYNDKIKNFEKDTHQLSSELYAANELLALRSDECKELSMELYELTDVKNKLMVRNEVLQKQVDFFKQELEQKAELLTELDMKKTEDDTKDCEKNAIITECKRTLNMYYKICSRIIYYKKYVEKELSGAGEGDYMVITPSEDAHHSVQHSPHEDDSPLIHSLQSELANLNPSDTNEISSYISEFLKCVRLLIFKKRVFESKLENAERKYNDFKEKLKEDRDLISDLKKRLRQNEENHLNMNRQESQDNRKYSPLCEDADSLSINYRELSTDIRKSQGKNGQLEKKNVLLLKCENEKLKEENKYLNEQINSLNNLQNTINEIRKKREYEEKDGIQNEYMFMAENKFLKFEVETITNELNIVKNKNEYLKKKADNYEDIIDSLQKEIIHILDKQKECDEEYFKLETELDKKNEHIEGLIQKRKEDQQQIEVEYSKSLKLEKEFLAFTDDLFKKECQVKELEETVKNLNDDIKAHIVEKEELKNIVENLKTKYGTFQDKYNDLYNIFEKEKQGKSEIEKKQDSALLTRLKNYDDIISELLKEKEDLLNKYEELKRVYDEKLKVESLLHKEINELRKSNEKLSEQNNSLIENVNQLVKQNDQYNIKLVDLDKEKFDLYMKYLKVSEELNNLSTSPLRSNHSGVDKKFADSGLSSNSPLSRGNRPLGQSHGKESKKGISNNYDQTKSPDTEREDTERLSEAGECSQNGVITNNLKKEFIHLEVENRALKEKINELEKLNGDIFSDNKVLIQMIADADKHGQDLKITDIKSMRNYEILMKENKLEKEENEHLKMEIYDLKNKIDQYSIMLNKKNEYEETNKRAKNYLYYLNDKIKGFIEIFSEKNFNYEYFKSELKKIKSTNLMIIEENFENFKEGAYSRISTPSKHSLEEDNRSVSSKIIVNFFTNYNDTSKSNQDDIIINKFELKKFYKCIIKLKEDYHKKCLLADNQKNLIEELNKEIFNYSTQNTNLQKDEIELKKKLTQLMNENAANVEKFANLNGNLISRLNEEVSKNEKLMSDLNTQNEINRNHQEKQKRIEKALNFKHFTNDDLSKQDEDSTERNLQKIHILVDQYEELVRNNSKLLTTSDKVAAENDTLKQVITKMDKEINELTKELKEKEEQHNEEKCINGQVTRRSVHKLDHEEGKYRGNILQHNREECSGDVIQEYEAILLAIEKKNTELENNCESYQKRNDELTDKYDTLLKEYNELKLFVKEKKMELKLAKRRSQNDEEDGDVSNSQARSTERTTIKERQSRSVFLTADELITLSKHVNAVETLNSDFLKNEELEEFIALIKQDIAKILREEGRQGREFGATEWGPSNEHGQEIRGEHRGDLLSGILTRLSEKEKEVNNYKDAMDSLQVRLNNKEEIINNLKYAYENELKRKKELTKRLEEKVHENGHTNQVDIQNEEMFLKIQNGYEELLNEYNTSLNTLEETKGKLELLRNEKDKMEKLKELEMNDKEFIIKKLELINTQLKDKADEVKKSLSLELQMKENIIKDKVDMLDELKNQVDFLKKEKSKNSKYTSELELQLANLNNEMNTLNNLLEDAKEEINLINCTLEEKDKEVTDLRSKLESYLNQMDDTPKQYEASQKGSKRNSSVSEKRRQNLSCSNEEMLKENKIINELKRKSQIQTNQHYQKLNELRIDLKNSFVSYNKLKFDSEKKMEDYEEEANNLKCYIKKIEEENEKKDKKYALIEIAIKEMDKDLIILKAQLEEKCLYIIDLEKNIQRYETDMQFLDEDAKVVHHVIMTYVESDGSAIKKLTDELSTKTKTNHFLFLKDIMVKLYQKFINTQMKRELRRSRSHDDGDVLLEKEKEILTLEEKLNKMLFEKNGLENEVRLVEQELNTLHEKRSSCAKELNGLINELEKRHDELSQAKHRMEEIERREKNLHDKESEQIRHGEEMMKRANELSSKENEVMKQKNELTSRMEELDNEKIHMEELKNDLMIKFEKLYNAQNDIKIKETKLRKIYEKLKNHNIVELLDINNNESFLNTSSTNNLNNSTSLKRIIEMDNVDNENGSLNLDSLEYTTYFKEFKKRIKHLKNDLMNREKDMEIYKKTLEIEKKEKELYKIELEKLKELVQVEQMNRRNLDEELEKYKNDDSHFLKSLKESEEQLNEKNNTILELQQKLIETSYEMSLMDNKSNVLQEKNNESEKKIEHLNGIISNYEKEINQLNKEKLNITRKSIEKIMDDGEDIKKLKDNLEDAHQVMLQLKEKNEHLHTVNNELQQANKDMRADIDILLSNIEDINEENKVSEKRLKQGEDRYAELKRAYEEKVQEGEQMYHMLSSKAKRKFHFGGQVVNHEEGEERGSQIGAGMDGESGPQERHALDQSVDQPRNHLKNPHLEETSLHTLNEKNAIIQSLKDKLAQYTVENSKKEEVIKEYKTLIDEISSKVHIFEDNLQFLIRLNEFVNENNYSYEQVVVILEESTLYRKILNKVLLENQFYRQISQIKEYLFDIIKKNASNTRGTLKLSLLERRNSKKESGLSNSNNAMFMSENIHSFPDENDSLVDNVEYILRAIDSDFTNFENVCDDICHLLKKEEWQSLCKKLNILEFSFNNVINNITNEIKKVSKKFNEKGELRKSLKVMKKKFSSLSNDFLKSVKDMENLNMLLSKESEKNELLKAENDELKQLYDKLNENYNDKLAVLQEQEYEVKNLREQLMEKNEHSTKTKQMNEFLKTDLSYLNTSLDQAAQNLNELNNENVKNKRKVIELTEENTYLKNQVEDKSQIIEHLEIDIESKNHVINELKEFNEMLIKKVEEGENSNREEDRPNGARSKDSPHGTSSSAKITSKSGRNEDAYASDSCEEIDKKELLIIIRKLENDNNILNEELEIFKNNFNALKDKKEHLEDIINSNDLALNRREIELNDAIIEKEKMLEESGRYKTKCIQIIDICFNKDFNIVDIREKIVSIFENEDEEIEEIINCHKRLLYHNDSTHHGTQDRNTKNRTSTKGGDKSTELQEEDRVTIIEQEKILHIEEMSKKNEELIKKNEEIWKMNKYIEDLNKEITNKNYIIIKHQQDVEDKNDMLEQNQQYIQFLKDQIKLLCNNIDENKLFDINNFNLSPTLRSFIKRKSVNARFSFVDTLEKKEGSLREVRNNSHLNEDAFKQSDNFDLSRKKRLSELNSQEMYNFYDENEVKLEEMNLKMDELTDKLKVAEDQVEVLKGENNELVEKCEFLKKELKYTQGTKRNLMLCESRLNILEKELQEKQKKLDAQNKTVNECVDMYVEENSENFNKILELKKDNEKYKIEVNILNEEIAKLKSQVTTYKNDIKNISSTLDFYKSTHDELVNEFSKEENTNVYYKKLCEFLKKENEHVKENLQAEEENKEQLIISMNEIREQLSNCIKENYEITLDLEFLQMQNGILKDSCRYYKEREGLFISNLNDKDTNLNMLENFKEENLKEFIEKLKDEINNLEDAISEKTKTIISLKYQIKEHYFESISKNGPQLEHKNNVQEIVNLNNMAYVQSSLFIYINLFKSVLFIISEILFFADPTNSLYVEILTLLKLRVGNQDANVELDNMIGHFHLSKMDCENIFQSVLKSKSILREKLQLLQLRIC
ncbi:conserved Plasmodium protein, unknown function [Plasmodium knowlesi strain H]|uniref:Uncharacterized protein n=3 Tax=Plasmodium knowlesi TaxID=5850 RepID=A0A5K1US97_PLAKH|nr:uncharacterized protein PKNH_1459900 [Plasmodium knowlesi strain H]OTN64053.1 Uncharacterized protein PKNOH_S140278500 [Plasmodium knowlesi]CAA9991196.1 conserved Plasmodium protein, unknown function [Plasmodium knowlesi strain H]SBO26250.1 conserved Plasmodium protein, unknown function [Plasmodium knowlesi strain H]SBO29403.1 conserved Plasmodium protein, unknown function [Plasmodium knowlesi strain H]VVS80670.1 conserved Plasmodium protein, unknown function [Plasmodium knowlesi strain H]|eukprot:XP_002262479.1 [Plasmodium knowlesi strain H]